MRIAAVVAALAVPGLILRSLPSANAFRPPNSMKCGKATS